MVWNLPKNPVKCSSLDSQSFVFSSSGVGVVEFMVIFGFSFVLFFFLRIKIKCVSEVLRVVSLC